VEDGPIATTEFDSVTTVMGQVLAKPALIRWAGNEGKKAGHKAAMDLWEMKAQPGEMKKDKFGELFDKLMGEGAAHVKAAAKAANIGTQVHKRVEYDMKKTIQKTVNPEQKVPKKEPVLTTDAATLAYMAFCDWAKEVELEPIASEERVASATHRIAGTLDLRARLRLPHWKEKREVILDVKSGGVYLEAKLQTATYRVIEAEMAERDEPLPGVVIQVPKTLEDLEDMQERHGRPFVVHEMPDPTHHFAAFLGLQQAYGVVCMELQRNFDEWVEKKERKKEAAA